MKKEKSLLVKLTKESPEARKQRVSSGVKFRSVIIENRKKRPNNKLIPDEENL